MENKQKRQTRKELNVNDIEKVNGGLIVPDDPEDDHSDSDNSGGGATGGW